MSDRRQDLVSGSRVCCRATTAAWAIVLVLAAQSVSARSYKVLHKFTGGADGSTPLASVMVDTAGNVYGTTELGGYEPCDAANGGCGTVFKLDNNGEETVLYRFGRKKSDGTGPHAGVILNGAANLYGTTEYGGASSLGTVFMLNKNGKETILHDFTGGADEGGPLAGLVSDGAGNFYGTTAGQNGTVFKLDKTGKMTVLYTFTGGSDGSAPNDLVRDKQGNLYGTTTFGGLFGGPCGGFGCGVVFKLDLARQFTILHSFTGGTDGASPGYGALLLDAEDNFMALPL